MTAAASSTRSGSIFAATSDEPYPSARVSKIAESWRSTPSSFTRATRARTSGSSMPSRSARTRYGRGSGGKSHWGAVGVFELVDVQFARARLFEERFFAHAHVLHRAEVAPARQITARCRVRRAPGLRLFRHHVGRRARGRRGASRGRDTA